MTKKEYMKPAMNVVMVQQRHIICASYNNSLQNEEVSSAWSRGNDDWDDEDE
jgi:hypothetical protein